MKNLINKFLDARTNQEVDSIVNDNYIYMDENPMAYKFANNAKKRIARLRREANKSWRIFEMN